MICAGSTASCTGGGTYAGAYDGAWLWTDGRGGERGRVFDADSGVVLHRFTGRTPALVRPYGYRVESGRLIAFHERTLDTRWAFDADRALASAPLATDDLVFVASSEGRVYAVDRSTGLLRWSAGVGDAPEPWATDAPLGLAAGEGYLVVPTKSGIVTFRGGGPPGMPPPGEGPAGGGGPREDPRADDSLRVSVAIRRTSLRTVLRRGLLARVGCSRACEVRSQLLIGERTARRLGIARTARAVSVGRGHARLLAPGYTRLVTRLDRLAARGLSRVRAVEFSVRFVFSDGFGNRQRVRRAVRLRA